MIGVHPEVCSRLTHTCPWALVGSGLSTNAKGTERKQEGDGPLTREGRRGWGLWGER